MIRSAAGKVMWVGRATVFLVGLAVILALLFGVASTAFAHRGDKGFFHIGHRNVTSKVSTLIKRGAGPALNLRVRSGPPMAVNSSSKVARLNADKLDNLDQSAFLRKNGKAADSDKVDGKDSAAFLPADTYTRETSFTARAGLFDSARAECDEGDLMIGGGYSGVGSSTQVQSSTAFIARTADGSRFWGTWSMLTRNTGSSDDTITVRVICADSSP